MGLLSVGTPLSIKRSRKAFANVTSFESILFSMEECRNDGLFKVEYDIKSKASG